MTTLILLMVLCAGAVPAVKQYGHHVDYHTEPHYSYEYAVHDPHTGDIHSQKEQRKGDHTQGEYSLVESDGTKRRVVYRVAGHSGFNAHVQRKGHAQRPRQQVGYRYNQPKAPLLGFHQPPPIFHQTKPVFHQPQPVYHQAYPGYSHPRSFPTSDHARSSMSVSTQGVHLATHTNHIVPVKQH